MLRALHLGYAKLNDLTVGGGSALHGLAAGTEDMKSKEDVQRYAECAIFLAGKNSFAQIDFRLRDDKGDTAEDICGNAKFKTKWSSIPDLSSTDVASVFNFEP